MSTDETAFRRGMAWKKDEDELLESQLNQDLSLEEIAKLHFRSPYGITCRKYKLLYDNEKRGEDISSYYEKWTLDKEEYALYVKNGGKLNNRYDNLIKEVEELKLVVKGLKEATEKRLDAIEKKPSLRSEKVLPYYIQEELENFEQFPKDDLYSRAFQDATEFRDLVLSQRVLLTEDLSICRMLESFSFSWKNVYVSIPFFLNEWKCNFYVHYIPSKDMRVEEYNKFMSAKEAIAKVLEYFR